MKTFLVLIISAFCFLSIDSHAQVADSTKKDSTVVTDSTTKWFNISDSANYKGKYKVEGVGFDYVEIVIKEAKIYFYASTYEGNLEPIAGKPELFDALGMATFSFTRNEAREITSLKIDYNGMLIEGIKEKPVEPAK